MLLTRNPNGKNNYTLEAIKQSRTNFLYLNFRDKLWPLKQSKAALLKWAEVLVPKSTKISIMTFLQQAKGLLKQEGVSTKSLLDHYHFIELIWCLPPEKQKASLLHLVKTNMASEIPGTFSFSTYLQALIQAIMDQTKTHVLTQYPNDLLIQKAHAIMTQIYTDWTRGIDAKTSHDCHEEKMLIAHTFKVLSLFYKYGIYHTSQSVGGSESSKPTDAEQWAQSYGAMANIFSQDRMPDSWQKILMAPITQGRQMGHRINVGNSALPSSINDEKQGPSTSSMVPAHFLKGKGQAINLQSYIEREKPTSMQLQHQRPPKKVWGGIPASITETPHAQNIKRDVEAIINAQIGEPYFFFNGPRDRLGDPIEDTRRLNAAKDGCILNADNTGFTGTI